MSRRSERAADRAAERAQVKTETQRLVAEGIERGDISALHWHAGLPWTEAEHRQVMVAEVEARAEALYESESPGELYTLTPWHHLPTVDRMQWRSVAYTIARVEAGWAT